METVDISDRQINIYINNKFCVHKINCTTHTHTPHLKNMMNSQSMCHTMMPDIYAPRKVNATQKLSATALHLLIQCVAFVLMKFHFALQSINSKSVGRWFILFNNLHQQYSVITCERGNVRLKCGVHEAPCSAEIQINSIIRTSWCSDSTITIERRIFVLHFFSSFFTFL